MSPDRQCDQPRTREVCACTTYQPGEECGMVVCWKCEQLVRTEPVPSTLEQDLYAAWSAADAAGRTAGALADAETGDEVTYLMIVEARDLLAKAMRREGFRDA